MDEAISRCLSQGCLYPIETRKTALQLYGKIQNIPSKSLLNGAITSSVSSGIVYFTYFSIYNNVKNSIVAGSLSSIVKIPISNSMRILQISKDNANIFQCFMKIIKTQGITGLYSGISLSIIEDIIEFDMRNRLYNMFNHINPNKNNIFNTLLKGCAVGAISSSICMPIDSLRSHLVFNSISSLKKSPITIIKQIGIPRLYTGLHIRVSISALKFALFYTFLEIISNLKSIKISTQNNIFIKPIKIKSYRPLYNRI